MAPTARKTSRRSARWARSMAIFLASVSAGAASSATPSNGTARETPLLARARQLADIPVTNGWQFPTDATLKWGTGDASSTQTKVMASSKYTVYTTMQINGGSTNANEFGATTHTQPAIKLVRASIDTFTSCASTTYDVPGGLKADGQVSDLGITAAQRPYQLTLNGADTSIIEATAADFVFMHGGSYVLCYTPDGTFGGGTNVFDQILNIEVRVAGVSSSCETDGCLADPLHSRWDCFFGLYGEASGNCIFNFATPGGRTGWSLTSDETSKMSWTELFGDDTVDGAGAPDTSGGSAYDAKECITTDPDASRFDGSTPLDILASQSGFATLPAIKTHTDTTMKPFTVAACYCPNYNQDGVGTACVDRQDFIQQFGHIFYWLVRVCDYTNPHTACGTTAAQYTRVLPHMKFTVHIDCPPGGGCIAGADATEREQNRIKIIAYSSSTDRPNWDPARGCATISTEDPAVQWSLSSYSQTLSGGSRIDYKVWSAEQPTLATSIGRRFDVCYCHLDCTVISNWIKVGEVRTVDTFSFAWQNHAGAADANTLYSLEFVNKRASLTMKGGIMSTSPTAAAPTTARNPHDANKFSGRGVIQIISFDRTPLYGIGGTPKTVEQQFGLDKRETTTRQTDLDGECQKVQYDANLIEGPSTVVQAKNFVAQVDADAKVTSDYFNFAGEAKDQTFQVKQAGTVALCYCARLTAGTECEDTTLWVFAGLMTIRGPIGGESWILPLDIVTQISVNGFGFEATDSIRIIAGTGTCDADNTATASVQTFKVGCPAASGLGCVPATTTENIPVEVASADSTGIYISGFVVYATYTELTFDSDNIAEFLQDGDSITIDPTTISIAGTAQASWDDTQKWYAERITGVVPYQDDATKTFIVTKKLEAIPGSPSKFNIPVGFTSAENPTILPSPQAKWTRHNKLITAASKMVKPTQEEGSLKICWAPDDGGAKPYYAEAGAITFVAPPTMPYAKLFLTTQTTNAIAPVVVFFRTGSDSARRAQYVDSGRTMHLLIRIKDTGKLDPRLVGDLTPRSTSEPASIGTGVARTAMKQSVCGKLFVDLWSNDRRGFPIPKGCYFTDEYLDNTTSDPAAKPYRDLIIEFTRRNGLRHRCELADGTEAECEYAITFNALQGIIAAQDPLVDLYSICIDGCARPYETYEQGNAAANDATIAKAQATTAQQLTAATLLRTDQSHLDLNLDDIIEIELTGGNSGSATFIRGGALLKLVLFPVTAWDVGSANCNAECVAGTGATCSGQVACTTAKLVAELNKYNAMNMVLPPESSMDPITATVKHAIKVSGVTMPMLGVYPVRLGVELLVDGTTKTDAQWTTTTGYVHKAPNAGMTTGMLAVLGPTGQGTSPFISNENDPNALIARITMGATLWRAPATTGGGIIQVVLPPGHTCTVAPSKTNPETMMATQAGEALMTDAVALSADDNSDGYLDTPASTLSTDAADGSWTGGTGECVYTFQENQVLYAGQSFTIMLGVTNPATQLQRRDETNVWTLTFTGKGQSNIATGIPFGNLPFMSLAEEREGKGGGHYQANVAVLAPLMHDYVMPTHLGISLPGAPTRSAVRVFFMSRQSAGQQGYVLLDAPDGYDFGESCTAEDLEDVYYDYVGDTATQLQRLTKRSACEGQRTPVDAATFNRAVVRVGGKIDADMYYGIQFFVEHPTSITVGGVGWYITVEDLYGYPIDGSREPARYLTSSPTQSALAYHQSYAPYLRDDANVEISLVSLQPYSVTTLSTVATVFPIELNENVETSFRLSAPEGYEYHTNNIGWVNLLSGRSTAAFPADVATLITDGNTLTYELVNFRSGNRYGFQVNVRVPDRVPTRSANAWTMEIGYKETVNTYKRVQAAVVAGGEVRSLRAASVEYVTNKQGYINNYLTFSVQLVSDLTGGQGIVISGDVNTLGTQILCPPGPEAGPGSLPIPSDLDCEFLLVSDAPQLRLTVIEVGMPAGYYRFELKAINPPDPTPVAGKWTFQTSSAVAAYPASTPVDQSLVADGFIINQPMESARLVNTGSTDAWRVLTGRIDRPLKRNSLIFSFRLTFKPSRLNTMILRAPLGFVFPEVCDVITAKENVFGENTAASFSQEYTEWPPESTPSACRGLTDRAEIDIPIGLERSNTYVFRIGISANPETTPTRNLWTIEMGGESSDPFEGFTLWTFTDALVSPTSIAVANVAGSDPNPRLDYPVEITFTPFNDIPAKPVDKDSGGFLKVTAPGAFLWASPAGDGKCEATLMALTGEPWTLAASEMDCEIGANNELFVHNLASASIPAGRKYALVAAIQAPQSPTVSNEQWTLKSFKSKEATTQDELDEVSIEGYQVTPVMNKFQVRNTFKIYNGKATVRDVEFTVQLPDSLLDGDILQLQAPLGFTLAGFNLESCNDFKWPEGMVFLPNSPAPVCACNTDTNECFLEMTIAEGGDIAFPLGTDLSFLVSTTNPAASPSVVNNFWRMRHIRSSLIRSSHVAQSWDVNPQLEEVGVEILSTNVRAESTGTLRFSFTPVSVAQVIEITAVSPAEFDFAKATVSLPYIKDERTEHGTLILRHNQQLLASQPVFIDVVNVVFGRGGGDTVWNLKTFSDPTLTVRRDERLNLASVLRLPGKIEITEKSLTSSYKEAPADFPVKSLFDARVLEDSAVRFTLIFSQAVYATEILRISIEGLASYVLKESPLILIGGDGKVDTTTRLKETGALEVTLMEGRAKTEEAITPDVPYSLVLRTIPQSTASQMWRFETVDGSRYPSNTNDGLLEGFRPVSQIAYFVSVERAPPKAIVEVTMSVDPGVTEVQEITELLIVAPPGFEFPIAGCGQMCTLGQPLQGPGRKTAIISSPTQAALTRADLASFKILTVTPEQKPTSINWFVETRGASRAATGWGEADGFLVRQMEGAVVMYPGLSEAEAVTMTFRFVIDVDEGVEIGVEPPNGYQLFCSGSGLGDGALQQLSLPGQQPACTDDPLTLVLTDTLVAGEYSFAIQADLPRETPQDNTFNLIIRNQQQAVVDAAYSIPGQPIEVLAVRSPLLSWDKAVAGQTSTVRFTMNFAAATSKVAAVLINFPPQFVHDIQGLADVVNLNKQFPVAPANEWADAFRSNAIRIVLDYTSGGLPEIKAGEYSWTFPVLLPCCTQADMPKYNVWFVSLCTVRTCTDARGTGILVSYPVPGFKLGEKSASAPRPTGSGAPTAFGTSVAAGMAAALAAGEL